MKRYEGRAFTSRELVEDCEVIGNRVVVYMLDDFEQFNKKIMSELGLKEKSPMTCFIKKIKSNDFDVSFWNLDGSQAFMCGHGSIFIGNLLNKIIGAEEINLFYDTSHYKTKVVDNQIKLRVDNEGLSLMETKIRNINVIPKESFTKDTLSVMGLMGLKLDDVEEAVWCVELRDLIFVVKSSLKMRGMEIQFRKMAPILDKMEIRNLCSTVKSDYKDFDFETRVFCPHDNLDEDTACGSSNMSIAKYWEKQLNKSNFKVLFPYHIGYGDRKVGGVQVVRLEHDRVFVGGQISMENF
jgi:predicted PhzF superfamily epimerase YddE/YHI9